MTTLLIENDGEIDVNGLRLLGATSKEGQENKIGFFGTGTKYAIATAMRLGIGIQIFSGEKLVKISKRNITFRGESYEEVVIDDERTGITIIPHEQSGFYTQEMNHKHIILPSCMCLWLYKSFGKELNICGIADGQQETLKIIEATERHRSLLNDAVQFLKDGGFSDIDKWPILIADLGPVCMGKFKDGKIYIGDFTFSMGRRQVAETLLEEYAHARTKQKDETREFQNVLLRFVIDTIENKTGRYL